MGVVRTVVTALPQVASAEKIYRVDAGPGEPTAKPAAAATHRAVLGATVVSVDLQQLLADLDAESRRLIGPSTPPRD
ncbi:MAG: hypothetical protein K8U03_21230 [Planctomycetia bacterium]|nr:hypothetical protein [Planctomycetia bacterium]